MPGRVNKLCFKHIYSTFQSISVQTHQSWMLIDFNVAKIWKHPDRPPLTAFAWSTVSRLQVKTHLERTGQFCVWVQRLPWPPKRKDPNKCQASVFQAPMIKPQAQLSMDVWSTLQTNNRHWRWCYGRSGGSADDDVMEDQVGQLTMMLWKIRWVSWRWCYERSGGSADDDVMEDQVGQLTMMLWKIRWVSWQHSPVLMEVTVGYPLNWYPLSLTIMCQWPLMSYTGSETFLTWVTDTIMVLTRIWFLTALCLALGEQKLDLALGRTDLPNRLSVKEVGLSFFTLSLNLFLLSGLTLIKVF